MVGWGGNCLACFKFYSVCPPSSPPSSSHSIPWRLPSLPNDISCHGNPKHDPTGVTAQAHIGKVNESEALYDFASADTTKKVP